MSGRRRFTRVDYNGGASIRFGENLVICRAENLSMQGIFFRTDQNIPPGTPVDVTVYRNITAPISVCGNVVRSEPRGVSVQINSMSVESFVQLRCVVTEKGLDEHKMMEETFKVLRHLNL